jgi:hypothetical protein
MIYRSVLEEIEQDVPARVNDAGLPCYALPCPEIFHRVNDVSNSIILKN